MNDYHSRQELEYRPRRLASVLLKAVKYHPVVVLTGARQVGKSTLIRNEFPDWNYFSFDDFDIIKQAQEAPESLWAGSKFIVIDEVQKHPKILEKIKIEVDNNKDIRFILSGSANLLLMKHVSESLAGRAAYFKLNPMCYGEINRITFTSNIKKCFDNGVTKKYIEYVAGGINDINLIIFKGGMPRLLDSTDESFITQWFDGYVRTYLERDLRDLSNIESLPDFRRLMSALALQTGNVLNQTNLANNLKLKQPTVHRYINLLETSYLFVKLPAFNVNRKKRLIKSPKAMWIDPGLTAFLCGYYSSDELLNNDFTGSLFESFVFQHLSLECSMMTPEAKLYYWRTSTGHEVDFVIEWGNKLAAVEVKMSGNAKFSDTKNLRLFMQEYSECKFALLVYTGDEIKTLDKDILAVPWYLI